MTKLTPEQIKNLANSYYRLNHLYKVINEDAESVTFRMREAQRRFYLNRWYRNCLLKARKLGFSTLIQLMFLDICFFQKNKDACVIAHNKVAATDIFTNIFKYAYDNMPQELKDYNPTTRSAANELKFANNSRIRVTSSARSGTPGLLHISEFGKICAQRPDKAREIITGSIPAVPKTGFIAVESTAEGQEGAFFDMCQTSMELLNNRRALTTIDMKFHFFPWYENPQDTIESKGVPIPKRLREKFAVEEKRLNLKLTPGQKAWYTIIESGGSALGEDMLRENPFTPEEAFRASVEGAYYKRQMDKAYSDKRVGDFKHDGRRKVEVFFDIGHRDATSVWFMQYIDGWYRFIDYEEELETDLPYWVNVLEEKGYKYQRFVFPHDGDHTKWGTGKTYRELALDKHGMAVEIAPRLGKSEGIENVRRLLAECVFDEENCDKGLKCLTSYKKEWDKKNGVYKNEPLHNWASHGADGFKTFATSEPEAERDKVMHTKSAFDGWAV